MSGERLVTDLGDKSMMLLRNHGTLSAGPSAPATWLQMFYLERACTQQIYALSAGRDGVMNAPQSAQDEVVAQTKGMGPGGIAKLAWPGFLRKLDYRMPGYAA